VVLQLLGCPVKSKALPTVTTCPVCQARKQLVVTLDTAIGGQWAYCRSCQFAGDMITLAARTWKLGIHEAIARLRLECAFENENNLAEAVDRYVAIYFQPLSLLQKFWQQCRQIHIAPSSPGMVGLQMKFNVRDIAADWLNRAGEFIGSADKILVDATIQYRKYADWVDNHQKYGHGFPSCTFTGPGWRDLLVIPFWDQPGRIAAFLFIGREGVQDKDYIYKSVIWDVTDGGLAMLPAILQGKHNLLGDRKFICTDVTLAIRLHARHSREHNEHLPLAASWDNGTYVTKDIWKLFQANELVFWGLDQLKTIKQARIANGKVSILEITPHHLANNMQDHSPQEWLRRIGYKVVPWATALYKYLEAAGNEQIDETLTILGIAGRELAEFVEGCPEKLRQRLKEVVDARVQETQVLFESQWVFERPDGWYLEKKNERISSGTVRIEQVVTTLNDRSYYRGVIRFNGQEYPFCEKAETLENGMLAWAYAYLRDVCHAGILEYSPRWNRKSIHLALKLSNPKYAHGVETIGWDSVNRQFNFPNFAIGAQGKLQDDFACLFNNMSVPGKDVQKPGLFPREHIDSLSNRNPETQLFWATAACVVSNIVADAVNRNQTPIILAGDGAAGIGASAAIRMGCVSVFEYKRQNHLPEQLPMFRWSSGWPAVIHEQLQPHKFRWLEQQQGSGFIFKLSDIAGLTVGIRGRVNLIKYARQMGSAQLLYDAAPYVIPNYLQDLYRRNIFLPDAKRDLAADVLVDLTEWFGRIGGDPGTVLSANEIMRTPYSHTPADYLSSLAITLFHHGLLKVGRQEHEWRNGNEHPAILQIADNRPSVWISQNRFTRAVERACELTPDILLITQALQSQNLLLDEPIYNNEYGWLVPENWWNNCFKNWRSDVGL